MIRLVFLIMLGAALSGCGGNTSWYFCSGTDEFCSRERHLGEEDEKPQGASPSAVDAALELSRKTPRLVEDGLAADGLKKAVTDSPEAVGGWLISGSLALLVDASDNAVSSRFFDQARYFLASPPAIPPHADVLESGLALLATVAAARDPAVAERAARLVRGVSIQAAEEVPAAAAARAQVLSAGGECCSLKTQAAAAVVLCDALAEPASETVTLSCQVARGWLGEELAAQSGH